MDHVLPSDAQGRAEDPGARSAAYGSLFFTAGSPEDAAYLTAMRARIDDDSVGRQRRLQEHHGDPRPFTESERVVLRDIMAPVLRDIVTSGAVLPFVQEEAFPDVEDGTFCVFLWGADGTGLGVWIHVAWSGAEQVARVAEEVQEWEIEELAAVGRSATWPECPDHPNSHPLNAVTGVGNAVWRCPRSGRAISAIGAFGTLG